MKQIEIRWEPEDLLPVRIPIAVRYAILRCPLRWQKKVLLRQALAGEEIPDQALKPIDYDYRPTSYWAKQNLHQLVANIKGAERKKTTLALIEEGRLDEANEFVLADGLSEEDRALAGEVHPALMGGEYLPDYGVTEVEIARVTMASTTQGVISIRAFTAKRGIGFKVVDEYNSTFAIRPSFSKRPLSLRQLVRLIDTGNSYEMGPIGLGIIQINWDCGNSSAESYADFMDFSSEFYPNLGIHYWFATKPWVERNSKKRVAQSLGIHKYETK
jgi:hypothetical protein